MKLFTPILAGAAVLALGGNVALADEAKLGGTQQPIQLTDTQMDSVAAGTGYASVYASSEGAVDVYGDFYLNTYPDYASASIGAEIYPYGPSTVYLSAYSTVY